MKALLVLCAALALASCGDSSSERTAKYSAELERQATMTPEEKAIEACMQNVYDHHLGAAASAFLSMCFEDRRQRLINKEGPPLVTWD